METEEQQFVEDPTLADPDGVLDTKYSWDENFQRHVAALLVSDRQFLLQSIDLINPNYFTNKAHSKICKIVFEFFKKYRILPRKDFIEQEIKSSLNDTKTVPFYLTEVNVIFDYFEPGMEAREYLQDKIVFFAKIQAVKKVFHESLKLIDNAPESDETWGKVYDGMREAMQVQQNFELGLDYFSSIQDRYALDNNEDEERDRFVFGLESLDKEVGGGGYSRGEIVSIVAASGVGKSVMLACLTANNLLRGKKGIYVSLELAEEKVAARMDAILTGLPVQNLLGNKEDLFEKLDEIKQNFEETDIGPLVIKQFPAGTATVNTIRGYISQLRFQGFDPDFVVVDYVGEMALHHDVKPHESRERIVRELRAMGMEEKVFVATAMQPNRDGKKDSKNERSRIDDEHLADSFGQIRPLDGCVSLNQNDTEKKLGVGRCYVIKQRDGKSRYSFWLSFDKESLRIREITQEDYRHIVVSDREYNSDETEYDMVKDSSVDKAKSNWKPNDQKDENDQDFGVGQGGFESFKEACNNKE